MTFSLLFLPRVGALPGFDALVEWTQTQRGFTPVRHEDPKRLDYHNTDTGVMFTLHHMRAQDDDEEDSLELHLEYCRPTFFALEAMTVLADIAEHFQLDVIDPQGSAEREAFLREALVQSWKEGNRAACAEMKDEGSPRLFLPEAKALEMWRFLQLRRQIQEMEEDFTIPKPWVVRVGEEKEVRRAAELPSPCLLVLPPVDVFIVGENKLLEAERVLRNLGLYLTEHDVWPWLKILDENALDNAELRRAWTELTEGAAADLPGTPVAEVAMDAFVDVGV